MTTEKPTRRDGERLIDFAKRNAEYLGIDLNGPLSQAHAERTEKAPVVPLGFEDMVPEVEYATDPNRIEMDKVLDGIDVLDAYRRWCGKMEPKVGTRRKNIMVSCPIPGHVDNDPSADLDLDKDVWNCNRCGQGGDKYDIAAFKFGFDVPGYKGKEEFPELRKQMAEDLGYVVVESGKDLWLEASTTPPAEPIAEDQEVVLPSRVQPNQISAVAGGDDPEPAAGVSPSEESPVNVDEEGVSYKVDAESALRQANTEFDWRSLKCIEPNTFLHEWLETTSQSHEPEEFYLWEGLLALGHAVGNNVKLEKTIRSNLMVCLVGTTGAGKSISMGNLNKLLRGGLPFDPDTGSGTALLTGAGSGEALLDMFNWNKTDPNTGTVETLPINGSYRENELASFTKKIGRSGNVMREILMDMYDSGEEVMARSRGAGLVRVRNHYMSFVTSTQPGAMGALLSQNDAAAGFLNRFAFVFGKYKERPAIGGTVVDVHESGKLLRKVRSWASSGREVDWYEQDAIDLWTDFYHRKVAPIGREEDTWMTARAGLTAKKIMLLLAVNDRSTSVRLAHVQAVIDMWPYLLSCYGVVEEKITVGMNEPEACLDAILKYLEPRKDHKFTMRAIRKQSGAKKFNAETQLRAINLAVQLGMVEETFKRGQDRAKKYQYVAGGKDTTGLAPVVPILSEDRGTAKLPPD